MAGLKPRRMRRGDIDSVLALSKKVGGTQNFLSYEDLTSMHPGDSLDMSYVVEDKGNIIGFLKARLEYVYVPVTEVCLIHAIVTDPDYQGQGIGSMLVKKLVDSCTLNEVNTIRALINERDTKLTTFIVNRGFSRSQITNYDMKIEQILDG